MSAVHPRMPSRPAPSVRAVAVSAATAVLCLLAPVATPLGAAHAQSADSPPAHQPRQTLRKPRTQDSRALSGVKRGTDAAGRGIERAGGATERGVNRASEAASRPVRRVGESFGRKLGGSGHASPPPVGPQGNAP